MKNDTHRLLAELKSKDERIANLEQALLSNYATSGYWFDWPLAQPTRWAFYKLRVKIAGRYPRLHRLMWNDRRGF